MKRLLLIFFLLAFAQLAFGQIDIVSGVAKPFGYSNDISPSQITSNQNDYNPTGLSTASVLRLNSDASRNITGLQGGSDGRIMVIYNVGTTDIVLKNEDANSTAAYRFTLGADLTLKGDNSVTLYYDATTSRWRAMAVATPSFATYQATPADPTGQTPASPGVMMGLAGSITPKATGKVQVIISGIMKLGTAQRTANIELRMGTGSAPANNDASTGTKYGATSQIVLSTGTGSNQQYQFVVQAIVSSLTIGTAYWIDICIYHGASTCLLSPLNISISACEL